MQTYNFTQDAEYTYFYITERVRIYAEKKDAKTILKLGALIPYWDGYCKNTVELTERSHSAMEHIEKSLPIWLLNEEV